jgi:hypothetical protein
VFFVQSLLGAAVPDTAFDPVKPLCVHDAIAHYAAQERPAVSKRNPNAQADQIMDKLLAIEADDSLATSPRPIIR